jgi:hypothetical protein
MARNMARSHRRSRTQAGDHVMADRLTRIRPDECFATTPINKLSLYHDTMRLFFIVTQWDLRSKRKVIELSQMLATRLSGGLSEASGIPETFKVPSLWFTMVRSDRSNSRS